MTELRYYDEITVAGQVVQVVSAQHWQLADGTDIVCRRSRDDYGRDHEWLVLDDHGAPARICSSLIAAVTWHTANQRKANP